MKRLWSTSLITKIFVSYLAVIVLLFASFYFFSSAELRQTQVVEISVSMAREARFLARVLPFGEAGPALDGLCRQLAADLGIRITVIANDGKVLGDSAEASGIMENHAARPEVIDAIRKGFGSATRYSTTVSHAMLYYAFYQKDLRGERVVRVAKPLTEVEKVIQSLRWSLLSSLFLASGLGLLLAWFFSRHLTRRFQRLEYFAEQVADGSFPQNFFPTRMPDEISALEQRLNEMSLKIRENLQQVLTEKEKADSILRCMIEGVVVLDSKGQVMVMNDRAKAMFGVPQERETYRFSMLEISRHPEVYRILEEVTSFDLSDQRYVKEVELDGDRWFRVNAVRLRDPQGQSLGSILVFHDVTDIKRFESMRSDFVANVSHELRTPLTAIRGYVETLLHAPPEDPRDHRQFLEIIDRHAERLTRLTEELLILSDLESGKIQLSFQSLDVGQLIQRVLEVFWDRATKKKIGLEQELQSGLPPLYGDADRLQQLFINLIDNAVKYTPAGGEVTIKASRLAGTNGTGQLEIAVSDTGPGIPEKDLPRLTERFYRVDKARSRDLGGTGLGLAIVKHIVQAHKGELKIESETGKGTTVRVRLPETASASGNGRGTILFLCTGNSCRSQMAEGFARDLAHGKFQIFSAGTEPKGVHALAVRVMDEIGIDISGQRSKSLADIPLDRVHHVITLCGDSDQQCPALGGQVKRSHWPIADPARAQGDEEEVLRAFRQARDEIRYRVEEFFSANHI